MKTVLFLTALLLLTVSASHAAVAKSAAALFNEGVWPSSQVPAGCPFPQSTEITGVAFTGRHAEYGNNGQRSADTWYPTWAADDRLYTPFTDGKVCATGSRKPVAAWSGGYMDKTGKDGTTTGFAVIEGSDPLKLKITTLGLLRHRPFPYGGQYPCGSLAHNGVWYYGSYALDTPQTARTGWSTMGPFVGFDISKDAGKTWQTNIRTAKTPLFGESGKTGVPVKMWKMQAEYAASPYAKGTPGTKVKIGAPHFVDFGKNLQHSPDGKAYLVAQGDTRPIPQTAYAACDQAFLLRVKPGPETMNDPKAYEFFGGHDKDGNPIWTGDFQRIKPLLEWDDHMGCVTMTYNAPRKKYLIWVTDTRGPENECSGAFDSYLLESSQITGPWKMVAYLKHFGDQAYFINSPSRFISADGQTMWMCFSGQWEPKGKRNLSGCSYALCLREFRFVPTKPRPNGAAGGLMRAAVDADAAVASGARRLADLHKIVFSAAARRVPTAKMPDGPLLGNGDVGVAVAGAPDALRFHIGKNDFWHVAPNRSGKDGAAIPLVDTSSSKHALPSNLRATLVTVGRVQLDIPAIRGATYKAECDMRRGEWRGTFATPSAALSCCAFVDANANRLIIELANTGKDSLDIRLQLFQGMSPGPSGMDFLYDPDPGYPNGRKVAGAVRFLGTAADHVALAPGGKTTVVCAILSDLDAEGPLTDAKAQVAAFTRASVADATAAHEAWWERFWGKSFVEIPDKVIEQHWYASQYIMASCSRPGKVAPGLWGNWITTDHPAWGGDFHLNYNFQAPFYHVYSSNHPDLSLPFYDALQQAIPAGQRIAARHGWKGVHLPVCIGPWGICNAGENCDWGQRSNAAYAALNFIWYWQYTQDKQWLRTSGYPYLREVEKFWTDYLKLEDGRYVIHNDSIHEGSSPDFNPILSLGLVRTLYKNILAMSEELVVDEDLRPKWKEIQARLADWPIQERSGKTIFRYTEKGMPWSRGNTLGIQHIFPAGAIGLDSDAKILGISNNMIDAMGRWSDDNGCSSWYTACARVGYPPEKILAELRKMYDRHSMPNKLPAFGGGGIENAAPALAVNEMLLQSHEGVLRLFPCWPARLDARFGQLRAVGAFLVSAELKSGFVTGVRIVSEQGRDCTVQNPWPANRVQLAGRETLAGRRLTFRTRPGEAVELRPSP